MKRNPCVTVAVLAMVALLGGFPASTVHAAPFLRVGPPQPPLTQAAVSRIPVVIEGIEGPGLAGFDISLNLTCDGQIVRVDATTAPSGLVPASLDDTKITVYLPLGPLGSSQPGASRLGTDFVGSQGDDGIVALQNEAVHLPASQSVEARLAYVYQSKQGTRPLQGGVLADIYLYVGRRVPAGVQVSLDPGPSDALQFSAFDGVPIELGGASGVSARVIALGDVNHDNRVDLSDAVLVLKVLTGQAGGSVSAMDVDGDGAVGPAEVLYVLQQVAGLR